MAIVTRMRDVVLSIGGRNVALCRSAEIHRDWEYTTYPVYRDSYETRTLRTLQQIRITLEKIFQENQDFFDLIGNSNLSFTLTAGNETHTIAGGEIIDYQLEGGADGELIEKVTLSAESYT